MLTKLRGAWIWFVEGLVEALLWLVDHARRTAPHRLEFGDGEAAIVDPRGTRVGRLVGSDGPPAFDPPDVARRLSGAAIDVVVPAAWLFRRDLDPVALASRPFLDAFVRHQIERITPWRVGDTHYRILESPVADDPTRIAVGVALVPKRLVARALAGLDPLHPRRVWLRSSADPAGACAIALGGRPKLAASLRRGVVWGLGGAVLLVAAILGYLQWQAGLVRADIDDQDRVLAERKAVLARARRGSDPGGEASARLRTLRDTRPLAIAVIDALSAAVPDSAHLTALSIDGDRVTVAGVSTDPSALVPALETAGAFADVAFGSATTQAESGGGDRFSLEMRILPPRSDHAGSPPGEGATGAIPIARAAP